MGLGKNQADIATRQLRGPLVPLSEHAGTEFGTAMVEINVRIRILLQNIRPICQQHFALMDYC